MVRSPGNLSSLCNYYVFWNYENLGESRFDTGVPVGRYLVWWLRPCSHHSFGTGTVPEQADHLAM